MSIEKVLVVPNSIVENIISSQGFVSSCTTSLALMLSHSTFVERPAAEGNPYFRQLIPYVAVLRDGEVFTMQRMRKQSEQRLHDLYSCGVGGHINPCDQNSSDIILSAAVRELNEELSLQQFSPAELNWCGFIYDSSNAVSRDHLGCVYILHTSGEVVVKETDKMTGQFVPPSVLNSQREKLETWSQLILPELVNRSLK